jgi:hypothetical protein
MVITLGPELEAALNELSQRQGVAPEVLALEALRDRFLASPPVNESRDQWERQLRQVATDCGVSLSEAAVSSEGIYEEWPSWSIPASWSGWRTAPMRPNPLVRRWQPQSSPKLLSAKRLFVTV